MKPNQIKAKLIERGVRVIDVAEANHVARPFVSQVIHQKRVSRRVMEDIARRIGKDPEKVFPNFPRERAA